MLTMADRLPYPAKVDSQPVKLFRSQADRLAYHEQHPDEVFQHLGLLVLAYFHNPKYRDYEYVAAGLPDEAGEESWTRDFGLREIMVWMAGFARDQREARVLHLSGRAEKRFRDTYGWNPDVIIEEEPSDMEVESFIMHECQDLDRAPGMPIEFFEGNE